MKRLILTLHLSLLLLMACEGERIEIKRTVKNSKEMSYDSTAVSGVIVQYAQEAKINVAYDLKDPTSVKFRNSFVFRDKNDKNRLWLCGEMNAKNSFGAYVGFRKFLYMKGSTLIPDEIGDGWDDYRYFCQIDSSLSLSKRIAYKYKIND